MVSLAIIFQHRLFLAEYKFLRYKIVLCQVFFKFSGVVDKSAPYSGVYNALSAVDLKVFEKEIHGLHCRNNWITSTLCNLYLYHLCSFKK